jgi:hypothetical protein
MMEESPLNRLPVVLRARDFRLYPPGGGRLVDLWQEGGRAVLGHSPAGVLRNLKNRASRGLFSPLPHPQEGRFLKALSRLLPNRVFRLYRDRLSLYRALEPVRFPGAEPVPGPRFPAPGPAGLWEGIPDPAFPPSGAPAGSGDSSPRLSLWRPFLEPAPALPSGPGAGAPAPPPGDALAGVPLLIPVLPWSLAPWVLALDPALDEHVPPSEPVSPVLLAAATRAVYDLIAAGPAGGRPVYPKINHALYGASPPGPWHRRGIYLSPPGTGWEGRFRRFLAGGFLIPPGPREPLILPAVLSPGEEAELAALLGEA